MSKLKIVKKPWGRETWYAHTSKYAGKILFIKKGCRLSLQYHKKKEETLFLEKGLLKITCGKLGGKMRTFTASSGYALHIPPKTIHRTEALEDCRILEVSTPHLDDVVRLDDDYNRVKKQ
jgi:mannose-6-phosphate isomerase